MEQKIKTQPVKRQGFVKASYAALSTHPKSRIFQKALYRHRAVSLWGKAAEEFFVGAESQSRALDFKDGVLSVACLTKELAAKIRMFAQRIIYVLNRLIGKELVFGLKVVF